MLLEISDDFYGTSTFHMLYLPLFFFIVLGAFIMLIVAVIKRVPYDIVSVV